jgi:hypothetical protein
VANGRTSSLSSHLIFLVPSPRLEVQTLAVYRMVTVQIAVAASCHVAVSLLVTSARRHMHWAEGRVDPRPLDNVPSAGAFLRVRLIPPVGAVRPLRHTPFHPPADDAVQYKLTSSLKVACSICCYLPTQRVALLFGTRAHNTSQETCGVASVPFRANSSIRITYLLTY